MFDSFINGFRNVIKARILPLVLIYAILISSLVYKVFHIQVVKHDELTNETTETNVINRDIRATRGNIYDRNGVLLAYNKLSYNVTLQDLGAFKDDNEENAMIYKLVKILEANGNSLAVDFYIRQNKKGNLVFTVDGSAEERFKRDAYAAKSVDDLTDEQRNATAGAVYMQLKSGKYMFNISDSYNVEDTLKIMSVRFALFLNKYNKETPVSVALNVDDKTVAAILESSSELPGVEISEETYRVYNDSKYFAHVLGYTGTISESQLEDDKDDYYSQNDQVGKTGIEEAFESYLRGEKGSEEITLDGNYNITGEKVNSEPVAGNDLYLTMDDTLQKVCYHLLEKNLASILLGKIVNSASNGASGKNQTDIMIPIYDVYNALFENNVIDVAHLRSKKASSTEKAVYKKFTAKEKSVIKKLKSLLDVNSKVTKKEAGSEMADYLDYFYDYLKNNDYIKIKTVDENDETFVSFTEDGISLSKFLKYAIAKKWLNLDTIGIGDEYLSTEEIYAKLMDQVFADLPDDTEFNKMIYKTLIYNYTITGTEICIILFDQGVLKSDKTNYNNLITGAVSPYYFIKAKIKSLEITPDMLALDPCSGSMVVTDPNTGDILAMVSYPGYDNNKLANKIDADYYAKLTGDKSLPLMDRPVQQRTAPGSTFKPIAAAAALGNGVVSQYEKVHDDVTFTKTDTPATCWSNTSHGNIDITTAIEVSCNYFFYEMGYRLSLDSTGKYNSARGLTKLNDYAAMFGFKENSNSGIELLEYSPEISDTDSVRSAIGQGRYAFTPTQISRYMSCVANGGTLNYLTLVDHIEDIDGNKVKNTISTAAKKKAPKVSLPDVTWKVIHDGLYEVVNGDRSSYSSLFTDVNTKVAGKSGTAQFSTKRGNHALFTSYAPYDDPKVSVTVVIPFGYTSTNAVRTGAEFYKYYFGKQDAEDTINSGVSENQGGIAD